MFAILFRVLEDLRFVGTYTSSDGAEGLHLLWRLGDKEGEGVDVMRFDEDGLIEDYRVMVRRSPLLWHYATLHSLNCQKRPRRHGRIPNKVLGDQPVPSAWMPMYNPILCGRIHAPRGPSTGRRRCLSWGRCDLHRDRAGGAEGHLGCTPARCASRASALTRGWPSRT